MARSAQASNFSAGAVGRQRGDADADRHALAARSDAQLADAPADALGDLEGSLRIGVEEQDGELIAAVARRHVAATDRAGQHLADTAQDVVSHLVPETVVEQLEVVDVAEQQGQPALRGQGGVDLLAQAFLEASVDCRGR